MRRMPLTILLAALGGCAGMDADECRTADWRAVGYEDGVEGKSAAYFGTRRKACAEHGVQADFDAYLAGRAEGVAHFCRPQNGYHLGTQGHRDPGVCPVVLEAAFVAAHADGYGLYERGAAVDHLRRKLHHSRRRAQDIEYLLVDRTTLLLAPHLAPSDRATLAVELKQLTEEKIELNRAIDRLENEHAAAELEYEHYRAEVAARRGD
jgi:Protein of unknown function (DUF2799)